MKNLTNHLKTVFFAIYHFLVTMFLAITYPIHSALDIQAPGGPSPPTPVIKQFCPGLDPDRSFSDGKSCQYTRNFGVSTSTLFQKCCTCINIVLEDSNDDENHEINISNNSMGVPLNLSTSSEESLAQDLFGVK